MAKSCRPEDEGAIYYWLGIHTQYLKDYPQAESWYVKAIDAFHKIGYPKREGRAHCNLGRVKMKLEDPSGMKEFEKAIALNPMDGIAHIDIGTAYLFADEHEQALDAFAEAVWADPESIWPGCHFTSATFWIYLERRREEDRAEAGEETGYGL